MKNNFLNKMLSTWFSPDRVPMVHQPALIPGMRAPREDRHISSRVKQRLCWCWNSEPWPRVRHPAQPLSSELDCRPHQTLYWPLHTYGPAKQQEGTTWLYPLSCLHMNTEAPISPWRGEGGAGVVVCPKSADGYKLWQSNLQEAPRNRLSKYSSHL